ncbi:O-acetylhomoserine aminocarboxypropyltransferase [Synergistales bacterium]|nr:O-acetylhomoserine aminocarboxypropyltransferase [Synergistales bacterium]
MAKNEKKLRFETLAIHGGQEPDPTSLSRAVPITRTSSFVFKSVKHGADLFGLRELGNIYTRLGNPTNEILEKRVSLLEGGAASVTTASGTSAIHYAIATIAQAGDEIVSGTNLYGGTYTMFEAIFPQFGLKTHFVDARDPKNFKKAITPKTKALYIETIGNPALDVTDVAEVAKIAHEAEIPLIVDGTFTTPYLLRSIDYGADIVINSLTKWIGGHGTAIGGIVTDAGKFEWKGNKKFPLLNEPDDNYHGLRWAHDLPEPLAPIAFAMRFRTVPLRNLGACLSPDNAWIFLQGLESLPFRMDRHVQNAAKVAEYLASQPKVAWVRFPGLKDDPTYPVASKYLKKGFGGMVVFGIKGGKDDEDGVKAGANFIEALELFSDLANVGDAKSLALHPASTSHSQLTPEQQRAGGLPPELVRLSIGIEHIDDILADIEQALEKA